MSTFHYFAAEMFVVPFEVGETLEGVGVPALPVAGLLTQFEILTLQVIDPVAQRGHIPTQILQQGHALSGVALGATGLSY